MCPMLHAQTHGLLFLTFFPLCLSVCLSVWGSFFTLLLSGHSQSTFSFPHSPNYSNAVFRMQREKEKERQRHDDALIRWVVMGWSFSPAHNPTNLQQTRSTTDVRFVLHPIHSYPLSLPPSSLIVPFHPFFFHCRVPVSSDTQRSTSLSSSRTNNTNNSYNITKTNCALKKKKIPRWTTPQYRTTKIGFPIPNKRKEEEEEKKKAVACMTT